MADFRFSWLRLRGFTGRSGEDISRQEDEEQYGEEVIKFSLIGRPNVGKSSIVNAFLGQDRVIVSDIAGTTRDAIDTPYEY